MRRNSILIALTIAIAFILVQGTFNKAQSKLAGAAAGYTGSPGDGVSCTNCHGGHPNFVGGSITTNIPAAGYTAGQQYTVTASITRVGHSVIGFELSPQDTTAAGNIVGTIAVSNSTTTKLAATGYVTHKSAGTTAAGGAISWTMNWTAPATGHGPVVFYADFNASNNNGGESGDSIFLTSLKIYENICTSPATPGAITGSTSVCANTSTTYSVAAVSGATSYTWTLPSGWSGSSTTNSITVTTGTTGGTVSVKANNSCGTSATASTLSVTVNTPGAAGVAITGTTAVCSSTSVTFTATPTNGGSPTYQWKLNGNNVGTGSTYSHASWANGDLVTCVMTSTLACVTGNPATSNTLTMTVTSPLTPAVSISASANNICSGTSVTFTPTPTNGGSPTYQWKVNGNMVGTGSTYTSSSFANGDVVTCVMTSSLSCVTSSTATSAGTTMVVNQSLTPSVSISPSANGVCPGTSVTFTATPTNGGTPTYQWKVNGNNVGTGPTYTSSSFANSDVVTCVMTSSLSCVTSSTATSAGVTMIISSQLTPAISIAPNANNVCTGTSVTFTATPTNGGTPTYQWKVNGNNVGTGSTYTSSSFVNGDVVTCVMTSSLSCVTSNTATSTGTTMVINQPLAPAVSISPSANNICSGTPVTFTATPTNGGTPTYQWKVNGNIMGTGSTYTSSSFANGNVVTCVMTSSLTCVTSATATSTGTTMVVNQQVTPAVAIVSNSGNSICAGQSVTLTATPTNGGTPAYQWLKGGNIISGQTGATYTTTGLLNGDVISVSMTSTAQCANPSTVTSNTITFSVVNNAVPSVTIAANPSGPICSSETVTFTATPANGGNAPSYQWLNHGNPIGGQTNTTYTSSSLANGDVISVSMTSNSTCVTSTTATSSGITVSVAANVTPAVTISSDHGTSVCSGQSVTFTANPTNGGNATYQWLSNGAPINGQTGSTYTTNGLANGEQISVSMTSSLSCASPSSATSTSVTISINNSLTASVSISANTGNAICAGQTVVFTATPTNGGSNPTYQWLKNGNTIPGETGATYSANNLSSVDIITVAMTSNAGCVAQPDVISNGLTFTVGQVVTPGITITANGGNQICSGSQGIFLATGTGVGATPVYQWQKNGTDVGTNNTSYTDGSLQTGDVISCMLSSSASCANPSQVASNSITITVLPLPNVTITATGNTLTSSAANTYQWFQDGSIVNGANAQNYVATSNGSYTVKVTDAHGCQNTSEPYVLSNVAVDALTALSTINIYPNPTEGILYVDLHGLQNEGRFSVAIEDLNGRSVLTESYNVKSGDNRIELNLQTLAGGIYLVQLNNGSSSVYHKLIINR